MSQVGVSPDMVRFSLYYYWRDTVLTDIPDDDTLEMLGVRVTPEDVLKVDQLRYSQ